LSVFGGGERWMGFYEDGSPYFVRDDASGKGPSLRAQRGNPSLRFIGDGSPHFVRDDALAS